MNYSYIQGAKGGDWILIDKNDCPKIFDSWFALAEYLASFAKDEAAHSRELDLKYLEDFIALKVSWVIDHKGLANDATILSKAAEVLAEVLRKRDEQAQAACDQGKVVRRAAYLELKKEFEDGVR
jgi:hypothetical protein